LPLPRRRLLPRRRARLGAARARALRVPVPRRERHAEHPGGRASDARGFRVPGEGETAMRVKLAEIGAWLDARLTLAAPIRDAAEHPIPRESASWWYVFGSAALVVFALQFATGILLGLLYVPSAGEAWNSLQALNHDVTLGWFIRALHGW